MKKNIFAVFILPLFLVSCGNDKATYTDTIASYIETFGGKQTRYNMDFEMKEIHEVREVTVADSVKYIQNTIQSSNKTLLKYKEKDLAREEEYLEKRRNTPDYRGYPIDTAETKKKIEEFKTTIAELKASVPVPEKYKGRNTNEVLAIAVKCTYAATIPVFKVREEQTCYFILSPDGKSCYHKVKSISFDNVEG